MDQRILVVGTGLIGGSLGLALRGSGGFLVRGFDRDPRVADRAVEVGALDERVDLSAAGAEADVVVVATPVGQIVSGVEQIARVAAPGTVVTDVGSAKGPIVAEAERLLGPGRPFVGGHPMAGTEGEGIDAARADLFEGALWILTPTSGTDPDGIRRVHGMLSRIGAKVLTLGPAEHDRLVALVSHLPYAVATVLMELAGKEGDERVFRAAAGSFRDVTRTAGSNPGVWRDILRANRDAVLREMDAFADHLRGFREALAAEDWDRLDEAIAAARTARQRFPVKGDRAPARPVTVEVPVPDRAGVLAEITNTVGDAGINIEDLWMDHTPGGGVVHIVLDGRETADRAAQRLAAHGFHAAVLGDR